MSRVPHNEKHSSDSPEHLVILGGGAPPSPPRSVLDRMSGSWAVAHTE